MKRFTLCIHTMTWHVLNHSDKWQAQSNCSLSVGLWKYLLGRMIVLVFDLLLLCIIGPSDQRWVFGALCVCVLQMDISVQGQHPVQWGLTWPSTHMGQCFCVCVCLCTCVYVMSDGFQCAPFNRRIRKRETGMNGLSNSWAKTNDKQSPSLVTRTRPSTPEKTLFLRGSMVSVGGQNYMGQIDAEGKLTIIIIITIIIIHTF